MMSITIQAQDKQGARFSPEKFETDLQAFIIKEAGLTQQEVAAFTPLYKDMRKEQLKLFERMRKLSIDKPQDDKGCKDFIRERDAIEFEQKRVQQTYHKKFLQPLRFTTLSRLKIVSIGVWCVAGDKGRERHDTE